MSGNVHVFHAVAFVENFSIKELGPAYPKARRSAHELSFELADGGTIYIFAFGAVVFFDVGPQQRQVELARIRKTRAGLSEAVVSEEFTVREIPGAHADVDSGVLMLGQLTAQCAGVVALTVAQSAAMEYYERIVDQMFGQTDKLVDRLEKVGTMPLATRPLHRFIGAAIGTRSEVLSVLHLLDKPDAVWDDPDASRIYELLRAEFDLVDRYESLELKLRSVQEALELVIDMARDRRLVLLEVSIVFLIVLEILLTFVRH